MAGDPVADDLAADDPKADDPAAFDPQHTKYQKSNCRSVVICLQII